MPKSPQEMWEAILRNLPGKTGKALEEWITILEEQGPEDHRKRIQWLKEKHGLGHYQATLIVKEAEKPPDYKPPTEEELLKAQYAGDKQALRPIYDRIVEIINDLEHANFEMRKTYVSFVRQRQFGIIQASTKTRIDLGLVLPDTKPTPRLQVSTKFGSDRITHKVSLTNLNEVDEEIKEWIEAAYHADA